MKKLRETQGITLVALVITIIILLILAGISIQAITNTGIFTQANNAKRESEIANIKEQIALDIYEKQLVPPLGSITDEQLETILGKYGTVNKEDGAIVGITTEKGYEILLKDIYGGETVAESVPDGAIVNPVNDIATWLKTGGISKQYSYTTIEQVIADSTCTQSLMNNENAMKYLARSTEFANAICASETIMTYLGQSAYIDDTVLNSDLWVSTIKASQYWEKVYTQKFTIHAGASEAITIDGVYGSFITNSDGTYTHALPLGEITLNGSVSGESFTRTITKSTTDVYVMPEHSLYWYGNMCEELSGGIMYAKYGTSSAPNNATLDNATVKFNTNDILLTTTLNDSTKVRHGGLYAKSFHDFTGYSKLKASVSYNFTIYHDTWDINMCGDCETWFGVGVRKPNITDANNKYFSLTGISNYNKGGTYSNNNSTGEVDVSELGNTTDLYAGIIIGTFGGEIHSMRLHCLYLE